MYQNLSPPDRVFMSRPSIDSTNAKQCLTEVSTKTPIVEFAMIVQRDRIDIASCRVDDNETAGPVVLALLQKTFCGPCIYGRSRF